MSDKKTVTLPMEEYNKLVEANQKNLDKMLTLRKEIEQKEQDIDEKLSQGLFCEKHYSNEYEFARAVIMGNDSIVKSYTWSDPAEEYKKLQEENSSLKKKLAIERIDRGNNLSIDILKLQIELSENCNNENFNQIMKLYDMTVFQFMAWRKL